jgi:hypothetical protein
MEKQEGLLKVNDPRQYNKLETFSDALRISELLLVTSSPRYQPRLTPPPIPLSAPGTEKQEGLLKVNDPRQYNKPETFSDALRMLSELQCEIVRKHAQFNFRVRLEPGGPLQPLAGAVREFSTSENAALLARNGNITKYTDTKLVTGRPREAALGIHRYAPVALYPPCPPFLSPAQPNIHPLTPTATLRSLRIPSW